MPGHDALNRGPSAAVAIWTLAATTFVEAVRARLVWSAVLVCAALSAVSVLCSEVAIFAHARIVVDLSLAAMSLTCIGVGLTAGVVLVARDLDGQSASVWLARPLPRWALLLGRFLGLWGVLVAIGAGMAAVAAAILVGYGAPVPAAFWPATALVPLEAGVVTAVAMALGTVVSLPIAATAALCTVVAGHLTDDLAALGARQGTAAARGALWALQAGLPQLGRLSLRPWAAGDLPVPEGFLVAAGAYAASYALLALGIGMVALARRRAV